MYRCILIVLVVCSKWPSAASEIVHVEAVQTSMTDGSDKIYVTSFNINNRTTDNDSINDVDALKICFYRAMDDIMTSNGTNRTCGEQFDKVYEQYNDQQYSGIKIRVKLLQYVLHHKLTQAFINNESCMKESNCIKSQLKEPVNQSDMTYYEKKTGGIQIIDMFFNGTFKEKYNAWTCEKIRDLRRCIKIQELVKCDYHAGKFYEDVFAYVIDQCGKYTIQYKQLDDNASGLTFLWFVLGCIIIPIFILLVSRVVYSRRYKRRGLFDEMRTTEGAN